VNHLQSRCVPPEDFLHMRVELFEKICDIFSPLGLKQEIRDVAMACVCCSPKLQDCSLSILFNAVSVAIQNSYLRHARGVTKCLSSFVVFECPGWTWFQSLAAFVDLPKLESGVSVSFRRRSLVVLKLWEMQLVKEQRPT